MYIKNILYAGVFIIGTLSFSCGREPEEAKPAPNPPGENVVVLSDAQMRMAGIEYGSVETRMISGTIQASGKLDVPPQNRASVSAPLGGIVVSTRLLHGSRVKKGETVAVMRDNIYIQLQQDYKEAFSQVTYLKNEFERQEELAKENINARKTFQKARADYSAIVAKLDGLKAKLQLINIDAAELQSGAIKDHVNLYSPINGYVTKVNVNMGTYVNPNEILFEIVNTDHLHAELTVFEKDISLLRVGQKVLFTVNNETKQRYARVYLIGKNINDDRSVMVHCHLDKKEDDLIPGMFLTALVETDSAGVTALPSEAIVDFDGRKYIFVRHSDQRGTGENASEARFKVMEVETGESESGYTQIILPEDFNLSSGVVVKGAYSLLSEMKNAEE